LVQKTRIRVPERYRQVSQTPHSEPRGTRRRISAIVSRASRVGPDEIAALMTRNGEDQVDLQIQVIGSSTEATLAANQVAHSSDVVIAVGGDGTVSDVATGIYGSNAALGIVPAGSTNIAARSLGIPAEPAAALALLAGSHRLRAIDIGRSDDRSFVHIAGAGFDAALFKGASPVWKRRLGWFAYLPAAVAALRLPPSEVRITADGVVLEARSPLVLIANGGSAVAPQFQIYPGITVDDGWLDVLIFTSSTPAQIARTLCFAGMQQLDRSPQVMHRRSRTVWIEAVPPLPIELDGDPRGMTPRQFSIVPLGLRVVAPIP
jgi:diacylglycerol kinase (ATP)